MKNKIVQKFISYSEISILFLLLRCEFSLNNLLLSLPFSYIIVLLINKLYSPISYNKIYMLNLVKYLFWLVGQIITSSYKILKLIFFNKLYLAPKIGWINCNLPDIKYKSLYAMSITLTPGTYVIDYKRNKLLIHTLWADEIKILSENLMHDKIGKL